MCNVTGFISILFYLLSNFPVISEFSKEKQLAPVSHVSIHCYMYVVVLVSFS